MSFRQIGLAFLLVILFMGVWAVILLAIILLFANRMSTGPFLILILVLTVLILASFFPYLNYVAMRISMAKGEGEPVPLEELQVRLEQLNTFDAPVVVQAKPWGYLFTWRYMDAKWWELFQQAGMTELYELHVKLNGRRHTATLTDVTRSINWGAGPTGVHIGASGSRGITSGWERGVAWGIRENFAPGKLYDYTFDPSLVKNPVINTILRSGWDVRFSIF